MFCPGQLFQRIAWGSSAFFIELYRFIEICLLFPFIIYIIYMKTHNVNVLCGIIPKVIVHKEQRSHKKALTKIISHIKSWYKGKNSRWG